MGEYMTNEGQITSGNFTFTSTSIEGVTIVDVKAYPDERGYFSETYKKPDFEAGGITVDFVQDNQSASSKGVLRGLHYQKEHPQAKLVRVISGAVFDVAVDLRQHSTTFGKWYGITLSAENRRQFLIPEGFAHGFLVLTDSAQFCYKCTDFYHPGDEGGLAWNDPAIGVAWPGVTGTYDGTASAAGWHLEDGSPLVLSEKDQKWGPLSETFRF